MAAGALARVADLRIRLVPRRLWRRRRSSAARVLCGDGFARPCGRGDESAGRSEDSPNADHTPRADATSSRAFADRRHPTDVVMTTPAMALAPAPGGDDTVPHTGIGALGGPGTRLLAGPARRRETLAEHCERLGLLPLPYSDTAREAVIDVVAASGLVGRGGGEFPIVAKLTAALRTSGIPIVVVNGSESEPASGKDALLLRYRPHLVLDGALLAAATIGAPQIVVYLHEETGATYTSVMEAVRERGPGLPGIVVTTCASGFVAGESSAIVSALSGGVPVPRRRSLPAATSGIHGRPTVVSNVETLAHLGLIGRFGADWFASAGSLGTPGSTLLTLAGD